MTKLGLDAVSMADLHHIAVAGVETRFSNHTICRCYNRRSGLGRDIDAFVELRDSAERRGPVTER